MQVTKSSILVGAAGSSTLMKSYSTFVVTNYATSFCSIGLNVIEIEGNFIIISLGSKYFHLIIVC